MLETENCNVDINFDALQSPIMEIEQLFLRNPPIFGETLRNYIDHIKVFWNSEIPNRKSKFNQNCARSGAYAVSLSIQGSLIF